MSENIPKKVNDITGVELTPGEPAVCLGNGEQGFECCCDECNYYLLCFPEFEPKSKEEDIAENKGDDVLGIPQKRTIIAKQPISLSF